MSKRAESENLDGLEVALRESGRLPRHVAIIMDGNGRWAGRKRRPRAEGHRSGVESVRSAVRTCSDLGIEYLTLYAFSTENWKRPRTEISFLMDLLLHYLRAEVAELDESNVQLRAIGQLNALPKNVASELHRSIEQLSSNDGLTLTLALSYSGRWDMLRAVQTLALDVRRGNLSPEDITEDRFRSYLTTSELPDPDVMIRTSGEMRLSNFLLWEMAYTEIIVSDTFWPAFRRPDLLNALAEYVGRERRFGMTGDQVGENQTASTGRIREIVNNITRRL